MDTLFFFIIIPGSAAFTLMYFSITIVRAWVQARQVKQRGVEAEAIILHAEIMNAPGRYVPLVKLKIAVTPAHESSFVTCIESIFPRDGLAAIAINKSITVRYNPSNISQLQLIKRPQTVKEERVRWQPVFTNTYLSMVQ
jgi:hypothetical protein